MLLDTRSLTSKMLLRQQSQSASSAEGVRGEALIKAYLAAFGVVAPYKVSITAMPPVFNSDNLPEWKAFVREFALEKAGATKRALYVILEFIRYMNHMKVDPFIKKVITPRETKQTAKFNVLNTYESLLEARLSDIITSLSEALRKTHLSYQFRTTRTKTELVPGSASTYVLTSQFVLETPKKDMSLEGELLKMQGFLFSGSTIPQQLLEKYGRTLPTKTGVTARPKSLALKVDALMSRETDVRWLRVLKTDVFKVYLTRARDRKLVLRIEVILDIDGPLGPKVKSTVLRVWNKTYSKLN